MLGKIGFSCGFDMIFLISIFSPFVNLYQPIPENSTHPHSVCPPISVTFRTSLRLFYPLAQSLPTRSNTLTLAALSLDRAIQNLTQNIEFSIIYQGEKLDGDSNYQDGNLLSPTTADFRGTSLIRVSSIRRRRTAHADSENKQQLIISCPLIHPFRNCLDLCICERRSTKRHTRPNNP